MSNVLYYRNLLAESGTELTPKEAEKVTWLFESLIEYVQEQLDEDPYFSLKLENQTTEEKLDRIKELEEDYGMRMGLKEYNKLKEVILEMCEIMEDDCSEDDCSD